MSWKITIEDTQNGFLLTKKYGFPNCDEPLERFVFDDFHGELKCAAHLLNYIQELIGMRGSKHDDERIFIEIKKQNEREDVNG